MSWTNPLEAAKAGDEAAFERLVDGERIREVTAFVVRPADTEDGYSRWPERAADPRRVESVFRRFGLPDHVN